MREMGWDGDMFKTKGTKEAAAVTAWETGELLEAMAFILGSEREILEKHIAPLRNKTNYFRQFFLTHDIKLF